MIPFVRYSLVDEVIDLDRRDARPLAQPRRSPVRSARRPVRAVVVGAGSVGQTLADELERDPNYLFIGFVDDAHDLPLDDGRPLLGRRDEIVDLIHRHDVDEVFVAYAPTWQHRLVDDLAIHHPAVMLRVVPSPFEALMHLRSVESRGDVALVQLSPQAGLGAERAKRALDLTGSALGLLVLSPIMAAVAITVKCISPGPVFFRQERVGRDGRTFTLIKFRTMMRDAEARTGPVLSNGATDPRLTGIGRWLKLSRVDEIPQLWNVLRGEMSLVGPRPERPYFVSRYERTIPCYGKRHRVRPGITGLAQVCAGYHTDARDKLRFDLIYASNQSIWLDLSILARTIAVMASPFRTRSRRRR